MDILDPSVPIELDDPPWRIYSRSSNMPPQYIGENAVLSNSSIADGCNVEGRVENSILFPGVTVGKDAVVSNSILMPGVSVSEDALIEYAIIAENARICKSARVGEWKKPEIGKLHREITVIGGSVTIGERAVVPAGTTISESIIEEVGK